jgi:threonylcarbamoyladenosine tRNA methylthiotransferase MtaB
MHCVRMSPCMAGKYLLTTLGCKVNQYESQQIRELVESLGMRPVSDDERPDITIVNTCAVTATAMRKSRQAIRRSGADTPVVVVGCGASAEPDHLRTLDGVEAVLGHHQDVAAELHKLLQNRADRPSDETNSSSHSAAQEVGEPRKSGGKEVSIKPVGSKLTHRTRTPQLLSSPSRIIPADSGNVKAGEPLTGHIERFAGHQRAYLKVQDGCDAFCTFCTVPNLRPTLRSKPIDLAVEEARGLVAAGHREIVITGVFLGAYGRPTAVRRRFAPGKTPLTSLVEALASVEGLERLRLSSLEPGDVDDSLLELLAGQPNCVPHLHLPLQSGSDTILRRMHRQYTHDAYLAVVDRVRATLDRPALTTDVMVGFPGETEADFEASLSVARYAGFLKIHAFPFSPRPGTPAARRRTDFVAPDVLRDRMRRLASEEKECSHGFRQRLIGSVERVIIEGSTNGLQTKERSCGQSGKNVHGRTDRYFEVHFKAGDDVQPGDLVAVRVDRITPSRTFGTMLSPGGDLSLATLPRDRV